MSIKSAIQESLVPPTPARTGLASIAPQRLALPETVSTSRALADTLQDLFEGVVELERYARTTDPRNHALLAQLVALKTQTQVTAESARQRLAAAMTGTPSRGSSSSSTPPF